MQGFFLQKSANGLPIPAYEFGRIGPRVLILGGVHGDEREGVDASMALLGRWQESFAFRLRVTVVPALNVDGVLRQQRVNANGVDLNRNMATNDWSPEIASPRYHPGPRPNSEPETQALIRLLEERPPWFVLSLHSWKPLLNVNGDCGREAAAIAQRTGYEIQESIGYPTPGCLGTYCGLERDMPTLTYEIERGLSTAEILEVHVPAIEEALKVTEHTRRKTL
ncbi:MAG: M14 family zinc carboxypeptidase [Bdellovibrionales bacterium]